MLDYNIDTGISEIQCIDNVFPDELAPERISVTMTLQVYRTPSNDPVASGISPGGEAKGNAQEMFTSAPYITVELRDKITDKTILFLPKAMLISRNGRAEAENLLTETWTIKSIGYIGPGSQTSGLLNSFKNIF